MSSGIDGLVEKAGRRMARGHTRRGFLGRVGAGAAGVAAARALGSPDPAEAHLLPGCYGTDDVAVCWWRWRVTKIEDPKRTTKTGRSGVIVRRGPRNDAPPLKRDDGQDLVISLDTHFGRQSVREPPSCDTRPAARGAVNGYVWGYLSWEDQAINGYSDTEIQVLQGWIPYQIGPDYYSVVDNNPDAMPHCGPANRNGADYDCYQPRSRCSDWHGCGGEAARFDADVHQWRCVKPESRPDYWHQVRWAVDSTAFGYLMPGDCVLQTCRSRRVNQQGGVKDWACIEVYCADWLPRGCQGWIREESLEGCAPRSCDPRVPGGCG